jgi:hypothetical protein
MPATTSRYRDDVKVDPGCISIAKDASFSWSGQFSDGEADQRIHLQDVAVLRDGGDTMRVSGARSASARGRVEAFTVTSTTSYGRSRWLPALPG